MRILHVIPFFTPQMGGSAQVCYQLARHQGERGHEVTVLTTNYGNRDSYFPQGPYRVIFLPILIARWGFYINPSLIPWASNHIGEFDIIHMHTVRTFQNAVVRYFAVRRHIPYILSAHGTLPVIMERQLPKRIYDAVVGRTLLACASRLVAVSGTEVNQYRQFGVEQDRIRVVYNGLNLTEFTHLPSKGTFRSKYKLQDPAIKIILFLGRIHKRKGIDGLIRAFARLRWKESPIFLFIVGPDEGEQDNLKRLADHLGIADKVRFTGPLYGDEKLSAYIDADILASPALYEIFGLVPFEALLCGTPVVVGDDCGTGELFAKTGAGYLVKNGDAEQLSVRLDHILTHPEEAQRVVQIGKDFVHQRLDWRIISAELENVYQELNH